MEIKELTLWSNNIEEQKIFYHNKLGFEILLENHDFISFRIGSSVLNFKLKKVDTHYHFAFNIPKDSISAAESFLKDRIELILTNGSRIIDFNNWNAQAIFFEDGNGNLAEVIARKSCGRMTEGKFDINMIQKISEIGIPLSEITPIYNTLKADLELEIYDGGLERFCAVGTENGLFICINKDLKTWYPIDKTAIPSPFEGIVSNKGTDSMVLFDGQKVTVL